VPPDDIGISPRGVIHPGAPGGAPVPPGLSTSRAIVRVQPVAPAAPAAGAASSTATGPLGRSGLDLLDVLDTADVHVARMSTAPVELEVGLERARVALLRGLPVDALVSLDSVWDGARRTEEGWYLRGGALLVLGLPGEGDRLAGDGLAARSQSTALRFLQSLARLALGDVAGARATLAAALQQRPAEPLLLAQEAIVQAEQGDREGAESLLRSLSQRVAPDDPLFAYARDAVRTASANRMRSANGMLADPARIQLPGDQSAAHVTALLREVDEMMPATRDPLSGAVHRFGACVALLSTAELTAEARTLLRALSSGGAMATSSRPEAAHAARLLLATIVGALNDGAGTALPPSDSLVHDIVHALRAGHADDALRSLRLQQGTVRGASRSLLDTLVRGALCGLQSARNHGRDAAVTTPAPGSETPAALVQEDERGPVVPLRLGLRLLTESAAERSTRLAVDDTRFASDDEARRTATLDARDPQNLGTFAGIGASAWLREEEMNGSSLPANASLAAAAPGMPNAMAGGAPPRARRSLGAPNAGAMAVICIILATCAAGLGYTAVAVAFGVGASWLAVRRMGAGADATPREMTPDEPRPEMLPAAPETADDTRQRG
jgi:hypothetical protein